MTISPKLSTLKLSPNCVWKQYIGFMQTNQHNIQINLSKNKVRVNIEQVALKWIFNAGKIIIIITELIALSALGYRFIVDRQIIDLHDQIKKQELFVQSQKEKENKYRDIQSRLSFIKLITEESQAKIQVMNTILTLLKNGNISTTNLIVNQNFIEINGTATTVVAINNFVDTLKNSPSIVSISIDDLSSSEQGINFRIAVTLMKSEIQ